MKGAALATVANPFFLAIAALGGLAYAVIHLIKNWDSFKESMGDTVWFQSIEKMLASFKSLLLQVQTLVLSVFDVLGIEVSSFLWLLEKIGWIVGKVIITAFLAMKIIAVSVFTAITTACISRRQVF